MVRGASASGIRHRSRGWLMSALGT
jgi:hypothetical protein